MFMSTGRVSGVPSYLNGGQTTGYPTDEEEVKRAIGIIEGL
jgi:hypothetical protein